MTYNQYMHEITVFELQQSLYVTSNQVFLETQKTSKTF